MRSKEIILRDMKAGECRETETEVRLEVELDKRDVLLRIQENLESLAKSLIVVRTFVESFWEDKFKEENAFKRMTAEICRAIREASRG